MLAAAHLDVRAIRRTAPGWVAKLRKGTTLIEVLVSIFVMAIGLVALLALFPLGAFEMADALRDDHVSLCVVNATALATACDLRHDGLSQPGNKTVFAAFTNPTGAFYVDANPLGPSYPVYVDGIGCSNLLPGSPYHDWVAGMRAAGAAGIPRRNPSYSASNALGALRWFAYFDDINFDKDATPLNPLGAAVKGPALGTMQRNYAYSWAYLLRRPKTSVPSIVEMWVVVYQQRPLALNNRSTGGDETVWSVDPNWITSALPNSPKNVIPLVASVQSAPPLRPGSWILDCTPGPAVGPLSSPGNARFYRVVGITNNVSKSGGTVEVEVDSPIIGPIPPPGVIPAGRVPPWVVGAAPAVPARFAVLEGVVEVIYKGTNWLSE